MSESEKCPKHRTVLVGNTLFVYRTGAAVQTASDTPLADWEVALNCLSDPLAAAGLALDKALRELAAKEVEIKSWAADRNSGLARFEKEHAELAVTTQRADTSRGAANYWWIRYYIATGRSVPTPTSSDPMSDAAIQQMAREIADRDQWKELAEKAEAAIEIAKDAYAEALRDGCDPDGAWDCACEALDGKDGE